MPLFDVNIHLPCGSLTSPEMLLEDLTMVGSDLKRCFMSYHSNLSKCLTAANFMLFNQALSVSDAAEFTSYVRQRMPLSRFTLLASLDLLSSPDKIRSMKKAGVDAIKFHSYQQKISFSDIPKAVNIAVDASRLNMPIFIDTSYGSTGMYHYNNLQLAAAIIDRVAGVPVVLLHSGGARAIEAMLLAESSSNVFLDMSFSVKYYLGSTIEQDLAFAYKRIGAQRVLYGSDFPYMDLDHSRQSALEFFDRNNFSIEEQSAIFWKSANRLFNWKSYTDKASISGSSLPFTYT
ncbi:hypothetical protein OMCYN_00680 [cyanobiont of Ornithocercus magnificus]|nr:hypothetical protein OMCYN_00680 [cyanobiont of Ornithocercus magnificus]